jgi:ribose transport system substrate-binding protein
MRKVTAVLATALAALALGACGGDDEEPGGGEAAGGGGGGGEQYDLTLIAGVRGDEFYITMNCGAQAAAREAGSRLRFEGPQEFDPSQQTPVVNAVAARRPDAVLIAPTDTQAMFAPIQQLASGGTEVVLVDTTLERPDMAVSQIASDNEEGGREAARTLLRLTENEGPVLVIGVEPGISTTDARERGFREVVEQAEGVEYLGQEFSNNRPDRAAQIVTSTLARNPELKGIFATNLFAAEGAASGLRQARRTGDVQIVGFDAGPAQVQALRDGAVQALIAQRPAEIGRLGVEQALAALNGQPVRERIGTGFEVITRENLDEQQDALYQSEC